MRALLVALLLLALPLALAKSNQYCRGIFEANHHNCAKFEFTQAVRDSERCSGGGDDEDEDEDEGMKLANCTTFYGISDLPNQSIDEHTAIMAQLITNVFENGDTKMGYAAVQKLPDCRGYTSGYIGFTTGTNDAYVVIQEYVKRRPDADIGRYLKELKRLSSLPFGDPGRDDVSHLAGYPRTWKETACNDAQFIQTELDVGHSMYLKPALRYAASAGVHSNLGKAVFYDTIIQHGWQYVEPEINLPRILQLTGPRMENETEQAYLTRFLTTRRQLVCCFPGDVWNDSASRMSDLHNLVDDWDDNKDLHHPVLLRSFGQRVTGKEDMSWDTRHCSEPAEGSVISSDLPTPDSCPDD